MSNFTMVLDLYDGLRSNMNMSVKRTHARTRVHTCSVFYLIAVVKFAPSVITYEIFAIEICMTLIELQNGQRTNVNVPIEGHARHHIISFT